MKPRFVMTAFIVAVLVLHGVVAWLTPVSYDDWDHLIWSAQHRHDPSWFTAFFARHYTFSTASNYVIARMPLAHAIATPLFGLAVIWGTFTIAMRRLPRFDAWADVAGIVVIAAFLWIAAPRCGLVMFHRPFAAYWLYGTAVTLWVLVPLRCDWRLRPAWRVVLVIAAVLAATATRQLGMLLIATTVYALVKRRAQAVLGARFAYVLLAAVVAGTVIGLVRLPFDFRGLRPGFELSLVALNQQIFENGELISLVGGLVIVKLVIGHLWPQHRGDGTPDTSETLHWFGLWLAYIVVALLGPRYAEASAFPGAVMICIATLPITHWVMTSKPLRIAILVLAVGINVIAWSMALSTIVPIHAEYKDRIAKLRSTPKGSVATVTTYSQVRPTFWAFGEDWGDAARRQAVAAQIYKLRDIEISPPFRRLETNPKIDIRLEIEGVTPEQLRAADAPEIWASTLRTARAQFDALVRNLRRDLTTPWSARLVAPLSYSVMKGRPLLVAAYDAGTVTTVKTSRRQSDDESRVPVRFTPRSFATKFPEAYVIVGDRATPTAIERNQYWVPAMTTELHAVVACDAQRCFLVEAFIPGF